MQGPFFLKTGVILKEVYDVFRVGQWRLATPWLVGVLALNG